jgi:TonB family protein
LLKLPHLLVEGIVNIRIDEVQTQIIEKRESRMRQANSLFVFLALASIGCWAKGALPQSRSSHQAPDQDGVYYVGPEVTAPRLVRTVSVPYPDGISAKNIQGMTVLAMVIDALGVPAHIQLLHSHGSTFDQAAIAALQHCAFQPGKLGDVAVPVWIDVRVVFRNNRSLAIPEVLITERDLPLPDQSQLEDKHHTLRSYTPPFPIHTVDADFADPFARVPYTQVAVVSVQVSEKGIPTDVRVTRGLGFGLDEKAKTAVQHYRFLPAMKRGKPIAASSSVMVNFIKF